MNEKARVPFTCPDCGKTLLLVKSVSRQRCPDCAYVHQKQKINEASKRRQKKQQAPRAVRKPRGPKPESNMQQIVRIAAEARRQHLSYGQYTAMMDREPNHV